MLDDVERSLTSMKHRLQHCSTFLLFSGVNNNVTFVWRPSLTLLKSEKMVRRGGRSVSRHFLGKPTWRGLVFLGFWVDFGPRLLSPSVAHLVQQCWMMLQSFGRAFTIAFTANGKSAFIFLKRISKWARIVQNNSGL